MIYERVRQVVANYFDVPIKEVTRDARFEDFGDESLELSETVMGCEEEFDIVIPDEDAVRFITVGQLSDYVTEKVQPKGGVWPPPPSG